MAMTQIDYPTVGAATWTDDLDIRKDWLVGHIQIGLTNFDNDSLPEIAQGSKCEIGGSYFIAGTDQTVTGSASASTVNYIYIETDGDVKWATTAPTWDDTKSGWYNGTDRAVARVYRDGSSNYIDKYVYSQNQISAVREVNAGVQLVPKIIEIGDWDMAETGDGTTNVSIAHGLVLGKIRTVYVMIRNDLGTIFHPFPWIIDQNGDHTVNVAWFFVTTDEVELWHHNNELFEGTDYNATSYNRGWITIWYDPS